MRTILAVFLTLTLSAYSYDIVCSVGRPYRQNISYQISPIQLLVNTIYPDVNMVIDTRDGAIAKVIQRYGTWSPQNIFTYGRLIKEGDTLLNVGAHIGIQTIVFAKKTGSKAKVYFFEPYEITRNILVKNIYINELQDRATVYPYAAGNTKMQAYIMVNLFNTGGSIVQTEQSLKKFRGPRDQKHQIQVDLVDNVLDSTAIIDFALLDVERLDVECLEGMKQTIKRSPNIKIVIEWSGYSEHMPRDVYLKHLNDLLDWFQTLKFKFWILDRGARFLAPGHCNKEVFVHLTKADFLKKTDDVFRGRYDMDLMFAPGNFDPNAQ